MFKMGKERSGTKTREHTGGEVTVRQRERKEREILVGLDVE